MDQSHSKWATLRDRRILVVEDEYYLADDLARTIADAGAAVSGPAASLAQAEELIACARPDLAVMDVNLRGEESYRLADALNSMAVPFLFASGYERGALPHRFSAVPLMRKPFTRTQLLDALSELAMK
jgi:DNA-binding response OmpR family regulator